MMYLAGLVLVPLWLIVALILLILEGRIGLFLICAMPTSVIVLVAVALIRDQRKASIAESVRYRVADDLTRPMVEVVADAEVNAQRPVYKLGGGLQRWD
jgi:hypothetical protein